MDLGFRWTDPGCAKQTFYSRPADARLAVLKLHGSTNWLRCPLCENIYIEPNYPISDLVSQDFSIRGGKPPPTYKCCHCSPTLLDLQIVSPSFVRELRAPNLIAIWKAALEALQGASRWLTVGYSFPDEDVPIRALFTRAYSSRANAPQVSAVLLNDTAKVNYESFFPTGSLDYLTGGFEVFLDRAAAQSVGPSSVARGEG